MASSPRPDAVPDPAPMLRAAAAGDEDAWRSLIARYWRRVFALARSRCGNDELAEEVAQSVFVTIAEQLHRGAYTERGRFESWLFRVTMNRLRDEFRRVARQAAPVDPASFTSHPAAPPTTTDNDAPDLAALRRAMQTLNGPDRDVIELRHHAALSFQHIAAVLGEPLGTVLARHHRALAKLRAALTSEPAPVRGAEKNA